MGNADMSVKLFSHTQLSKGFRETLGELADGVTDGKLLALTAIRTCYSSNKPSEIVAKEGAKYLKETASDGGEGKEADRLIRMIVSSGHTSTLEGITFNFTVEGVSRALLAQLTRHRVGFSFSVQSQRYVRMGSDDRIGGFDYVVPESVHKSAREVPLNDDIDIQYGADEIIEMAMQNAQLYYDKLREVGVSPEDCRAVLPNAAATNLVLTANLRALLDFYAKRKKGRGAQAEVAELAERLREEVVKVEPWTNKFFEEA